MEKVSSPRLPFSQWGNSHPNSTKGSDPENSQIQDPLSEDRMRDLHRFSQWAKLTWIMPKLWMQNSNLHLETGTKGLQLQPQKGHHSTLPPPSQVHPQLSRVGPSLSGKGSFSGGCEQVSICRGRLSGRTNWPSSPSLCSLKAGASLRDTDLKLCSQPSCSGPALTF